MLNFNAASVGLTLVEKPVLLEADVESETEVEVESEMEVEGKNVDHREKTAVPKCIVVPTISISSTSKASTSKASMSSSTMARGQNSAPNCSIAEVMNLLRIIKDILPIGEENWKRVLALHSETHPCRDVTSIKRKFQSLHRKPIPTGDPECPEEVQLAKRLKHRIGQKASIGDGEDEFELEDVQHGPSGANQKATC